ncbi:MAG: TolC family protein [Paludibacteraceae bacterium]|nr:TolC family protein [Prevotella sp.]MBQ8153497.1 TolC family protein [Prevotella sp.]MBQ8705848.1 TolC family protein [Paludibacteraceae bacterium]MBQ8715676.1 TolC family protein [Prevotella sp.]
MNKIKRLLLLIPVLGIGTFSYAQQLDDSGISAGFFDSSEESTLNFSTFHLPPLSVLFENAKQNPQILALDKAEQIAKAEIAKQKRHILSYVRAHASYSYGKTDVYGQMTNNQTGTMNFVPIFESKNGTEQSYWNVGVNLNIPLEDILDWAPAAKRKRLEADKARLEKDIKFEDLKLQISTLYAKITNTLVTLKTASEGAAAYQGAGALNQEDFHQGNMDIEDYAWTKLHELDVVKQYQVLQTEIMTDILTLEIISRTPIITNATTEVTLDGTIHKSESQIRRENKAMEKRIAKEAKADEKRYQQLEREEKKAQSKASRMDAREASRSAKAARAYEKSSRKR